MKRTVVDERIALGAACTWWGPIAEVATTDTGLPCCPTCQGPLLQVPDETTWWRGVDLHETEGHPGYRDLITWLQGRCHPNMAAAIAAYDLEPITEPAP